MSIYAITAAFGLVGEFTLDHRVGVAALAVFLGAVGREWRLIRLRVSLNRALHEVRRPLQALALESPRIPVAQAIRAVGDLDRHLNGGPGPVARHELVACRLMVDACIRRWRSRAHLAGAEIELRWAGPDALVRGDGIALAAAIENLLVNAIEHGGPQIAVSGITAGHWVRIEIADSGRASRPPGREGSPDQVIAAQRAGSARGHGLAIVERIVLEHGGRFDPEIANDGSKVTVALPCSRRRKRGGSGLRVNW